MFILQTRPGSFFVTYGLSWSPDGRLLASCGDGHAPEYSGRGELLLWDVGQRRLRAVLSRRAAAHRAVAFSPTGETVVSASADRSLRWWDLATVLRQADPDDPTHTGGRGLKEGRRVQTSRNFTTLSLSPDGRSLVVASAYNWGNEVLDAATGERRIAQLTNFVAHCAAFSPDGRLLALGDILFDTTGDWAPVRSLQQGSQPLAVAFSPDGRALATAAGWSVKLWDVEDGRELATLNADFRRAAGLRK